MWVLHIKKQLSVVFYDASDKHKENHPSGQQKCFKERSSLCLKTFETEVSVFGIQDLMSTFLTRH